MTIAQLTQAEPELSEADAIAVLETKRLAERAGLDLGELIADDLKLDLPEAVKRQLGEAALKGHKRQNPKTRARRKPDQAKLDYHGVEGRWASYLDIACRYESKIPSQDRNDWRHDCMIELDRAERRDGKPLPDLRAYRIASLMVALHYRKQNRFATRVCVFSGCPVEPHCRACQNKTNGSRCAWLAVRPVASLDSEIVDPEGYRIRLLDTVATDKALDLPDKWYELNELTQGLPLRIVEIAYKLDKDKPLSNKDRLYLSRWRRQAQKYLF